MPTPRLLTALLLASSLTACASQGDTDSSGSGPGGKGDDGSEETGLHVRSVALADGLNWPQAVDEESEVDDAINAQLDFETIAGEPLADVKARIESGELFGGVVSSDFEVEGNVRNVLSVSIQIETLAAYPDFFFAYPNFNSNTGEAVVITDLLIADKLPELARQLDLQLQERIAETKEANREAIEAGEVEATQWDDLHVTAADLASFSTTADGITFHWDAGFPHVIQALEPDGEFAVSMFDLEDYISGEGLWAEEY